MAQPSSGTETKKIRLKILVDLKSKKVVFAEAGKDFVDFIFSIMTLPISTITKLLMNNDNDRKGMVMGSVGKLYKSIECLDGQYYESNVNKDLVLNGRSVLRGPLLPLKDADALNSVTLYRCQSHSNIVSDRRGLACPSCKSWTTGQVSLTPVSATAGFVKEVVPYMVMDDLEVKPLSLTLIRSLIKDFDYLEEKEVDFDLHQGLALLKASLENEAVLTTVFLGNNKLI